MNVLILTKHLNVGGITSYALTLGRGLKLKGHSVYIASSGGEMLSEFIKSGMVYIPIPIDTKSELSPRILKSLMRLAPYIREKHVNIIHANTRVTQVLAFWLNISTGVAYVSTCHGFFRPHFFRKVFHFWGKKVIAISDEVKKHLIHDLRTKEKNIEVVYNGVNITRYQILDTRYKIEARKEMGLKDGPVVGIIARLSDVKGHKYLIQAFKDILKDIPAAQLLIIGEGKMKDELEGLIKELNLENSVYLIPSVTNMQKALSVMDVFVMPSLQEGLGLSLMEAMAEGLAVVASDAGGIRNLIKDGFNGRLVAPKDVAGLARAIKELLNDKDKSAIYGANARKFIADNFSQTKMIDQTERVYKECLNA